MVCIGCQKVFGWLCNIDDSDVILSICESSEIKRNKDAWYDKIKLSLFKFLCETDKYYNVYYITMTNNSENTFESHCSSNEIIDSIWDNIKNSDGVKIIIREIKSQCFKELKITGQLKEEFFADDLRTRFLFIKS